MKKTLLLVIPVLSIFAFTASSVNAYDCSSEKTTSAESSVVVSNDYKKKSSEYNKSMKENKKRKNKKSDSMDILKMKLSSISVEKLQMVQTKMNVLKERIQTDHPKYFIFNELETFINGLIGTKSASWDLVDIAIANGWFPTLIAAVQAAWLVDTLKGEWPFTIFAPTEEAFSALLASLDLTAEELLWDKELLTSVLTYHVLPGLYQASDVLWLSWPVDMVTVQGSTISLNPNGWSPMVNDSNIIATDVFGTNWVIHVIDTVLLP